MRVLVTGGLGFQGCHLVRALAARGHYVTILATPSNRSWGAWKEMHRALIPYAVVKPTAPVETRPGSIITPHGADIEFLPPTISVAWGSIESETLLRRLLPDAEVVVHLAAMANPEACGERPLDAVQTNVHGTLVLLEGLRILNPSCRFVYASSCEVYGGLQTRAYRSDVLQTESSPMNPTTIYAATKASADRLVNAHYHAYGTRTTIVRPCNIYGPGQRAGLYGGVIPTFVECALRGDTLRVTGSGAQSREYMHVSDVVAAYVEIAERTDLDGKALNLTTGERVSVNEISGYVLTSIGGRIEYTAARRGDPKAFWLDGSEALNALKWRPTKKFADGLKEYIEWVRGRTEVSA